MSRIGKMPITVPAGVTVTLGDKNTVTVKGSLGELTQQFPDEITIENNGGVLNLGRCDDEQQTKALHGLSRALLHNMVVGVTTGYTKTLEIVGVGYKAEKAGTKLTLSLGYSHPIVFEEENGITFTLPNPNTIVIKGADKQAVGEIAAVIRGKRPPEPYLGKGVKYANEHIRRKAGKAGK